MTPPLFESPDEIADFETCLNTRAMGKRIQFFNATQSTNDLALDSARTGGAHGTVFVADEQRAGRGRRGRSWACPPEMGLLVSVLIRPAQIPPDAAGWIPLAAGFACAEALTGFSERLRNVTIKWPNDIVLPLDAYPGWKKLGGILCESALPALSSASSTDSDRGYAVIGIGLNLNQTMDMLPETEKAPATSVRVETQNRVSRKAVLKSLLEHLEVSLLKLEDAAERAVIRVAIDDKMRAWLSPWRTLQFRHPALGSPSEKPRLGNFEGLDEFGRIRIRENDRVTACADAEIIGILD